MNGPETGLRCTRWKTDKTPPVGYSAPGPVAVWGSGALDVRPRATPNWGLVIREFSL